MKLAVIIFFKTYYINRKIMDILDIETSKSGKFARGVPTQTKTSFGV